MTGKSATSNSSVSRAATVAYGLVAYALFVAAFAYALGFLANAGVPKGIDDGPATPAATAVVINCGLLGLFAAQHSVMARPWFKRRLTRFVPRAAERSTYVLAASLAVALLFWQWRPLPAAVWSVEAGWAVAPLWAIKALGVVIVVGSTFAAGHLKMFGVKQVLSRSPGSRGSADFRRSWLFWIVRHPIMVGFMIAFWASPQMSAGRLLFNTLATGYILVAVEWQERDLQAYFGASYEEYVRDVPRFLPRLARSKRGRPSSPFPVQIGEGQ
ncbi:MAG TPA: NnrU family protein [Jiangellaceae bacterium]